MELIIQIIIFILRDCSSIYHVDISSGNYNTNLGKNPISGISDNLNNITTAINNSLLLSNITYKIDQVTGCSVFSSDNDISFNIYF